ncbi:unnamed protein product [Kuraishia capsulata CBS 1993]|uniref:Dipeptidase n=1 Tax=Kuraishia capsulata CBS 1993 TaxID=1382522 RepID=W6MK79_9ASCO|nr:uncharacterized protein KUCA_T00000969001 [Kuraishia capsulata CBS 1993]CDK25002.1 unnamed protein product [Kuraishia capsulata CBS 1993]
MAPTAQQDEESRYAEIARSFPIVDTHNDFPYLLRVQLRNQIHTHNPFNFNGELTSHTDLPKLRKGGVGIQFFSCFIECKNPDYLYQDFDAANSAVRDTLEQIDVTKRLIDEYPDQMEYVTNSVEALEAFQKHGKIAVTMGVEGLHQVDTSLGVLREYFHLGVRYITLTHNCDNPFATAASSVIGGLPDKGLSDYGRSCVKEMNRLGMMVDLSHVSYKTMHDVLDVTKAPVLFSHSSAFSLTQHERNVRDDVLVRLKDNGGVVCVNFFPGFIAQNGSTSATIHDAVDHIAHIIDIAGWDHVGMGSDFDGIPEGPKGLEDVSKYPDLLIELMKRTNASDEQIKKVMGGNVLRIWRQNEDIAKELSKEIQPVEENWKERSWKFYGYVKDFPEVYPGSNKVYEETTEFDNEQTLFITEK